MEQLNRQENQPQNDSKKETRKALTPYSQPINTGLDMTDDFLNFAFKQCFTYSLLFINAAKACDLNPESIMEGKASATQAIVKILESIVAEKLPAVSKQIETNHKSPWIERLCESITEALESGELPVSIGNDLAELVLGITSDYTGKATDHAHYLLPIALHRATGGKRL